MLKDFGIILFDTKLNAEINPVFIQKIREYLLFRINEKEFEKEVDFYRFEYLYEEFVRSEEDMCEYFLQNKKLIEKDARKTNFMLKKANVKSYKQLLQKVKKITHINEYPKIFYDESFRSSILIRQSQRCFICDVCIANGYPHLHHVDYNKENCDASNLVFLCPRCHGKTNSNREFWQQYLIEKISANNTSCDIN